jgi:hypothetical protein
MNVTKAAKLSIHTARKKLRHPRPFQSITVVKMAAMEEMVPAKAPSRSLAVTATKTSYEILLSAARCRTGNPSRLSSCARPFFAIVPDGFHRAPFHCLLAESFLLSVRGLFVHVGMTLLVVRGEVTGRCFTAQIAIDALIIHVKPPGNVLRKLVCEVCHNRLGSLCSELPMMRYPQIGSVPKK